MSAVKNLVIVGRDAPVWLSACVMQYALGPAGVAVAVVELPPRTQPADLCISLPALESLHDRLRIDESRLIVATRGAFTLGLGLVGSLAVVPQYELWSAERLQRISERLRPGSTSCRRGTVKRN